MNVGIIGSGNVADVLAITLFNHRHTVSFIASRNSLKGKKIAKRVNAAFYSKTDLLPSADLIILAVSDNAIPSILDQLKDKSATVVHTSGATDLSILQDFKNYGVFYPVNTIKSGSDITKGTYFCIEANSNKLQSQLKKLATSIHCKAVAAGSDQRLAVHVAAVFANNFVNACYQSAYDILKKEKISFDILKPLMNATLEKVLTKEPRLNQTGPAVRNDFITLKKHKQYLKENSSLQKIYKSLSVLIEEQQKNK